MTKYEKEKENIERRKQIRANIAELQTQLNDARDLLAVIPHVTFTDEQERQTVKAQIRKLSSFLKDEEDTFNATFADDGVGNEIINKLGV